MNGEQYIRATEAAMVAQGFDVQPVQLAGGSALVGYENQFKVRWFATRLHVFIALVAVSEATPSTIYAINQDSVDFAKSAKGRFRGVQSGVAVLPVIVANHVSAEAVQATTSRPEKGFAVLLMPTLVDLSRGIPHTYEGAVIWGAIYTGWLRRRLAAVLPELQAI